MNFRAYLYLQLQRLIGSRVDLHWRELQRMVAWSADSYEVHVQQQLDNILGRAITEIPFYRSLKTDLDPRRISSFPIMSKPMVTAHFRDLMSDELRWEYDHGKRRGYRWVEVRSGGTTGVPVAVIHGSDFRDHDRAVRMLQMELCGFPFGVPHFRLWGSMQDINQMKDSLAHRFMALLARETLLNAFKMEDRDKDHYLDRIEQAGTPYLIAYVDAAAHLARYALTRGHAPSLTSVMACAGTVTDEARSLIETTFNAKVYNKYGSRDAGEIACECSHGGLHILPGVVLEVVDDEGNTCADGVSGRLLVTTLHNRDFPLIRYEIGDCGALSSRQCPCGRPFPLLNRIEGRSTEFLQSTSGGFISPVFIRHLIGVVHPPPFLKNYQLEQVDTHQFILRLECEATAGSFDTTALRRDLIKVLGNDAQLEILRVESIPLASSGKFQYVINRLRP